MAKVFGRRYQVIPGVNSEVLVIDMSNGRKTVQSFDSQYEEDNWPNAREARDKLNDQYEAERLCDAE